MGLLDQLANEALSALANPGSGQSGAGRDPAAAAAHPGMMDVLTGLLGGQGGQGGGLGGLVAMAQQAGLGNVVASWIGTGQNLPISADQLQSLLGSDQVAAIAQKLSLSPDVATQMLSQVLPHAVDHLTPDGQVPHNDLVEQGLAIFRSLSAGR
ncbi:YidB family protein [Paucibacter sp. R3-3]|uniref:YidB family protein n=1 Tax=Roseateles agri TaxID=3098619 RepID=A0ABU5DH83_9BURK|nr:YidB family protein [Paucibacter sp. R3-3]MDY0745646.1 YidB family protein [Paucibacter sp. R3-3]